MKAVTLQTIQSSGPSSACPTGSNCQIPFSGILIPPQCTTDLNIGHVPAAQTAEWRHPVFRTKTINSVLRLVPNCRKDPAELQNDQLLTTNAIYMRTIRIAYWDAAEKYYSVCMHGRTSVGNPVGQYNPNSRDDLNKPAFLNPDARYKDLYNIRYTQNSGLATGTGNMIQTDDNKQSLILPTTYNPESFAGEVRYVLPPLFSASFPMCVRQGTTTPSGSASATVVQGAPVILPLRCAAAPMPLPEPAF
jgi:hypothetical protein